MSRRLRVEVLPKSHVRLYRNQLSPIASRTLLDQVNLTIIKKT